MKIRRLLVASAASALVLAGCSTTDGTPQAAPGGIESTTATVSTTTSSTTTTPPSTTVAPTSDYSFTSQRVGGTNERVTWDVTLPQVTGGRAAVAAEFNESMQSALDDQIDGFGDSRFTLSDARQGPSYIGDKVISAVLNLSWDANPPGAHPTYIIATVTVNSETGGPVTLQDLFPNTQEGLQRLSDESAYLLPGTPAGEHFELSGIEPTVANFANWVATPAGMNIRFGDYQVGPHAIGLVDVTIPWDHLADVADPYILGVLSS